ncbi:hypothetical protein F2Q68_00004935 [Brassica cretica]|uniref:Uncharacterized protein n=1 Tax=Brassica cretica TaxID=69181 RepID=A0A8S9JDD0_BRACR|nr:hypothetical protein F2Q68_00004935 [Brassica cretica]
MRSISNEMPNNKAPPEWLWICVDLIKNLYRRHSISDVNQRLKISDMPLRPRPGGATRRDEAVVVETGVGNSISGGWEDPIEDSTRGNPNPSR